MNETKIEWHLHHDNWTDSDWLFAPDGELFCLDVPDDHLRLVNKLLDLQTVREELAEALAIIAKEVQATTRIRSVAEQALAKAGLA